MSRIFGDNEPRRASLAEPRIKKQELLTDLAKSRDGHRATFDQAINDYKIAVIAELESRLEDAKKGKRLNQSFSLVQPADHTKDYDRIIRQLEMDVDDEVDLSQQEFANYVMDQWAWSDQFTQTAVLYNTVANDYRATRGVAAQPLIGKK